MSGGLTGPAAVAALNYVTGRSLDMGTAPQSVQLALLTAPPPSDPGVGDLSEVSAAGYVRQNIAWSTAVTPSPGLPSTISNSANVLYGPFTAVGGLGFPVTHCALLGTTVAASTANLLSANQSDIETDASAWTGLVNAVLAQSATHFKTGSKSLSVTSNPSSGDTQVTTVAKIPVSPYTTYLTSAWAYSAVSGSTASVELAFYDSSNVLIQRSGGSGVSIPTGAWTQYTYSVMAPSNAVSAAPILHGSPTTSGTVTWWDNMSLSAVTTQKVLMTWQLDTPGTAAQNESLQVSAAALDMTLG